MTEPSGPEAPEWVEPFDIASTPARFLPTVRAAVLGQMPVRYETDLWDRRFKGKLQSLLTPGMEILDIGAGSTPTVLAANRPPQTRYVGLDIDRRELAKAPPGSYDEEIAASAETQIPSLVGRFDLVLSFFVMEHVRSTEQTLANAHAYLKPGGWLLAQMAGRNSPFAVANRMLSGKFAKRILERTTNRRPETVFPANYDRCTYSDLTQILTPNWDRTEVTPLFTGVRYVLFSRVLVAGYIAYEEWASRQGHSNLAPYYFVAARKPGG